MRLREWSGWKVTGAILLWLAVVLSLIGWSLLRTAKALEAQLGEDTGLVLVAFKGWQVGILLLPPLALLVLWVGSRRGRE
jgi:hypothetical protein